MISPVNSSISAINAAVKIQTASAHNVANSNTDGYKSLKASTQENLNGSVTVHISKDPQPGTSYFTSDGVETESSNVNYAREVVNQINARTLFAANVAALKTYQEMEDSIIDMMG